MGKTPIFPDLLITLPVIFLTSLSVLVVYSSSPQMALQQVIFTVLGLLIYWVLSSINFEMYNQYTTYLYIITLVLLVIVFILGIESRGSVRWISLLGLHFQPSELGKPVLILLLAKFWSTHQVNWKEIFKSLVIVAPIVLLVFKQPDLGTALTILAIWLSMLIGANISLFKLALGAVISLVLTPFGWMSLQEYQKLRVISFFYPEEDPLGVGYNVIQSMIAVGSGQIFGRGLGSGTQSRLQFLPEFRTDFIFASIGEEFGFIGTTLVLVLYILMIGRIFKIIGNCESRFGNLLAMGVLGMLFFQTVVNIGMNLGLMPITGITLPLLSYGGSSLVTTLVALSLVTSVGRFSKKRSSDVSEQN